jgi:hypothetical protein
MMSTKPILADAVIIGGGAAGSFCAITAARRGLSVIVLEPNEKIGRKLRITGKGRCNVTNNSDIRTVMNHIPDHSRFLYGALTRFSPEDTMQFYEDLGIPLKTERGNRVFPVSDNANDIADALQNELRRLGVTIIHEKAVDLITEDGRVCAVETSNQRIRTDRCVIATGGKSYPKTGSEGSGYRLASKLGHSIVSPLPSLVPLVSDDRCCAELQGLSLRNIELSAYEDDKSIYRERGEMLFSHFGITGPLVLSASAHMRHFGTAEYKVILDLKPALDEKTLDLRILRDFSKYQNKAIRNALGDLLPKAMIPVILSRIAVPGGKPVHEITKEERKKLVHELKNFTITINGTRPIEEAVVTAGGVSTDEINPRTMESKLVSGLYFAGEIMDLDAYTGGYNLQIAWSTANLAGNSL